MGKKKVAVIFGGFSPEYEVSLKSSYSIIKAIDREKYDVILIGITKQGQWFRFYGEVDDIPNDNWRLDEKLLKKAYVSPDRRGGLIEYDDGRARNVQVDIAFPVLHGRYGEDGTVQGLCELAGIPVVGCGSASSALCMDKDRSHKLVSLAGVKVPKFVCFEHLPSDELILEAARDLKLPVFVKPMRAGSSLGITKVSDYSKIPDAARYALGYDNAVLIEEGIEGTEIGCSVIGNRELRTGKINEIEVDEGFFTYEEKYTLKSSRFYIPARIDEETESRVKEAAKTAYRALGCRGYARIDMYLTLENEPVFLEANTIPGFTAFSQFPRMMAAVGIEYPELVDILLKLSLQVDKGEWYG